MIDIFFDYFGYDKEHHFVASIAYEYVIICHGMPRIITINKNNIIVWGVISVHGSMPWSVLRFS